MQATETSGVSAGRRKSHAAADRPAASLLGRGLGRRLAVGRSRTVGRRPSALATLTSSACSLGSMDGRVSATTFSISACCMACVDSWYFLLSGELIQAISCFSSSSEKVFSSTGPSAPGRSLQSPVAHHRVVLVEVFLEFDIGRLAGRFALGLGHLGAQVFRAGGSDRIARLLTRPRGQRFDAGLLQVDELLDERGLVLRPAQRRA